MNIAEVENCPDIRNKFGFGHCNGLGHSLGYEQPPGGEEGRDCHSNVGPRRRQPSTSGWDKSVFL